MNKKQKISTPKVLMYEKHTGFVDRLDGDRVIVRYDDEEQVQVYQKDQFVNGIMPKEGDTICAQIMVTREPVKYSMSKKDWKQVRKDLKGFKNVK